MKDRISILRNLFVILLTGVLITSCEKDKPDPADNLVGTWTAESAIVDAKVGGMTMNEYFTGLGYSAADAQLLTNLFNVTVQQNFTGTITFNSDKTYTSTLGNGSDTGTWALSNDSKQLTIDSATDPAIILNIDKLSSDELKVNWNETGQQDLNNDNVAESITANVKMTFTK
ncbi:MAG TPA: DUF4923 family protein [Bacteroidales bacterium]|jgi:hypothetical protein|nr:DUF4923 family protein [Bacteroidales bacterium]